MGVAVEEDEATEADGNRAYVHELLRVGIILHASAHPVLTPS